MKPFAVRYRDTESSRPKLSALRFVTAAEAHEYGVRLIGCGAKNVAVVQLDARRRYVSSRSIIDSCQPKGER